MNTEDFGSGFRFSQSFFLSAGEVNAEGEMALPLLVSKIIDIATAHANSLGIGNPSMAAMHRGWVLSRLALEMERYPLVNCHYTLTTWVEMWTRHFSERIIMVSDEEGRPYGYCRTVWMVLDYETRESVGLSHLSLPAAAIIPDKCPIPRQGRHFQILSPDAEDLPKGAVRANAPTVSHTFLYTDLDYYRHVNTVRYVSLLLNQFTLQDFDETMVHRLELAFLHEATYAQTVTIRRHDTLTADEPSADGSTPEQSGSTPEAVSSFYLTDTTDAIPILFAKIARTGRPLVV